MAKTAEEKQAIELAKKFIKTGLRGSTEDKIRNKLGNKAWPLVQKVTRFGGWGGVGITALSLATGYPIALFPAALTIGAAFGADRWARGHIQFLQNVTLRQAAFFGRSMKNANVPEAVRQKAMEYFLKKESPMFTARKYIQKNPDMVARLKDGQMAKLNKNFVSIFDENTHALSNLAAKEKRTVTFLERMAVYKKSWQQFQAAKAEEKAAKILLNADAPVGKAFSAQKKASRLSAVLARSQMPSQTVAKAAPAVLPKTLENGAKRLPISAKLMEKIGSETVKKTGAKIAGLTALKVGAKKIPILGAVFGTAFAAGRAAKGDWTGAGLEFCSGAASCAPGVGTAASLTIDGALLARDLAGGR